VISQRNIHIRAEEFEGLVGKRRRHRVPDGSDRTFRTRAPMGYGRSLTDHKVNWMYEAQPDRGTNGVPIIFGAIPHGGVSR
jgi:hypothetical protein